MQPSQQVALPGVGGATGSASQMQITQAAGTVSGQLAQSGGVQLFPR